MQLIMPSDDAARRRAGFAWGALGVLAFSVSLPATRMAVAGGLPGGFVGIGRAVVAGVLALITLAALRQGVPSRRQARSLVIVAVGVVFGFPWLTALALMHVPSAHGAVINGFLPAATAVMAVLRSGERPSLPFWAAAAAGMVCVVVFALVRGAGSLEWADGLLFAAVVLCALGYAEGGALAREMGGVRVICLALVISLPLTVAVTVVQWDAAALSRATPGAWAGFAYTAVISMFAGFFAWYRGLALGGVARVGQVQLIQPVLSLIWAWLLLGEAITWAMAVTAVAVLACVVVTQRTR